MIHVVPVNDIIEHDTDSMECACNPVIDVDNGIVIHESLDRREVLEQIGKNENT
jgi:hypothetical protein